MANFTVGDKVRVRGSKLEGVVQTTIAKRDTAYSNLSRIFFVLVDHPDGSQREYSVDEIKKIED